MTLEVIYIIFLGNGIIHPVQEHVNTLGIDCSIQKLTENNL